MDCSDKVGESAGMAGRAGRFARLSLMSRPDQLAVSPMGHSNEGTKSLVLVFVGLIVAEYLKIQSPLPESLLGPWAWRPDLWRRR